MFRGCQRLRRLLWELVCGALSSSYRGETSKGRLRGIRPKGQKLPLTAPGYWEIELLKVPLGSEIQSRPLLDLVSLQFSLNSYRMG